MKVLIAEDNVFSLTLLKKTLLKAGYDVVAVESGDEAWKVFQEEEPPQLAMIDWMMPGLSGVELCRKIRGMARTLPCYLILLTARSGKEDVLEGFAAGADDFIKKPFDSGELMARIQVGRRMIEQHALLHCLIDSIPDPIYFKNSRGMYLGCNKAYSTFVGKNEAEIISHPISDILSNDQVQTLHMQDMEVLATGTPIEQEGWETGANGEDAYYNVIKIPYLESAAGSSGMIAIHRDLTGRIRMEQQLRRLAVAVEQSTETIYITAVDGTILYVNSAFETTTGYSSEEAIGQTPALIKSGEHDDEFYLNLWMAITSGEVWEGRMTNRRKDGTIFIGEMVIYPIWDDNGIMINFVAISRDVTRELAIENQMRQKQKMNAIGELAGGISRDFNNILTTMLGHVALCLNTVDEESQTANYLNEILTAGDRAAKLVRQILTFSQQEELHSHPVALQSVIEDSLDMVKTTIAANITVEMNLEGACGTVQGETTQFQQVIVNLCTNAVFAMGVNEGRLRVSLRAIKLMNGKHENRVIDLPPGRYAYISVEDSGCGIAQEAMGRIFEPYYSTKEKGAGFGLSIVHGVVQKYHGFIAVESEQGKGTTVHLYFPLLETEGTKTESTNTTDPDKVQRQGRILFVDDDDTMLSMGREILESSGYTVVIAINGRQALRIFSRETDRFDALISGYKLPEMNGNKLVRECLRLRKDLPTILYHGYKEIIREEEKEALGGTLFLAKPVDWRRLVRQLRAEIDKRK